MSYESTDGKKHSVSVKISCSEELVLNRAGEGRALSEQVHIKGITAMKMGKANQKVLGRVGDDVRIDWGYLYLAVPGVVECGTEVFDDLYAVYAEATLDNEQLFILAYDDIDSITYFGESLKAYWKKDGKTIEDIILESAGDYKELKRKCDEFSERLYNDALTSGGGEYAELLLLAYRQVMAAHKLVIDKDGNNLYISKECFSNGCAATVDVTYPSSPMYLLYNTELLKGMLRPILKYAEMSAWKWDFAPHDVGTYPVLNGQTYCDNEENQMPVEECGNMIILIDAVCRREKNYSFANDNIRLLKLWSKYLEKYGEDPGNQLCTDDFAGHMPHNVNLSIKAVMGLIGFSDILKALGNTNEAERIEKVAREYADSVITAVIVLLLIGQEHLVLNTMQSGINFGTAMFLRLNFIKLKLINIKKNHCRMGFRLTVEKNIQNQIGKYGLRAYLKIKRSLNNLFIRFMQHLILCIHACQ